MNRKRPLSHRFLMKIMTNQNCSIVWHVQWFLTYWMENLVCFLIMGKFLRVVSLAKKLQKTIKCGVKMNSKSPKFSEGPTLKICGTIFHNNYLVWRHQGKHTPWQVPQHSPVSCRDLSKWFSPQFMVAKLNFVKFNLMMPMDFNFYPMPNLCRTESKNGTKFRDWIKMMLRLMKSTNIITKN